MINYTTTELFNIIHVGSFAGLAILFSFHIYEFIKKIFYINKTTFNESEFSRQELRKELAYIMNKYESHPHVNKAIKNNNITKILNHAQDQAKRFYSTHQDQASIENSLDMFISMMWRASLLFALFYLKSLPLLFAISFLLMKTYLIALHGTILRQAKNIQTSEILNELNIEPEENTHKIGEK